MKKWFLGLSRQQVSILAGWCIRVHQLGQRWCVDTHEAAGSFSKLNHPGKTLPEDALFLFLLLGRGGYCPNTAREEANPLPHVTSSMCPAGIMKWARNSSNLINLHELKCMSWSASHYWLLIKKKKIKITYLSDTWTPASPHFLSQKADSLVNQIQNKSCRSFGKLIPVSKNNS